MLMAATACSAGAGGCGFSGASGGTSAAAPAASSWPALANRFVEDYFKAQPAFAVSSGRHEYDGRLPDWSAAGLQAESARLKAIRQDVERVSPASLDAAQQLEREHVLAIADADLFWLDKAQSPYRNPAWYLDDLDPDVYLSREYAPLDQRMRAYIAYARAIPAAAADIRMNMRLPLAKSLVERAISGFGGYADFYRDDVPKVFASIGDKQLQSDFATANAAAARAMDDLKAWFQSQAGTATSDFALGPDLFAEMLRDTERVTVPLDTLEAAGRADLARNQAALTDACAKYLPGGTVNACIDTAEAHKPANGAVPAARAMLDDLRSFIREKDLVTIPGDEQARVAEAPPYNRANTAYINVPGPYDVGMPSTYYVAPPDPKWSAKERAAYIPGIANLTYVTIHEVWPGHFLQFLHTNRTKSIGSIFVGYAYAEGWAHYAEELMWEAGYGNGDPEQHVGQLINALLRDVRFLSAIGLHTHGMTLEQSEQMFRDDAHANPATARQQAARGTYDPAYLNYTLGKLMIRKLRTDWMKANNRPEPPASPSGWKDFHDAFLSHGGMPIPLVRRALLGNDSPPL
jgi:uncharacterized protein (DUF885 family)